MTSFQPQIKANHTVLRKEWACRILLTINILIILGGPIAVLQTKYQLVSPLIPQSALYDITYPHLMNSLCCSVLLLVSIWFYFYKKLTVVIILQAIAVLFYEAGLYLFVR